VIEYTTNEINAFQPNERAKAAPRRTEEQPLRGKEWCDGSGETYLHRMNLSTTVGIGPPILFATYWDVQVTAFIQWGPKGLNPNASTALIGLAGAGI
jgi:hypothetical protein